MQRVLAVGYLRGADLWHVACGLYLIETLEEMPFITLDARQKEIAGVLGMSTVPR